MDPGEDKHLLGWENPKRARAAGAIGDAAAWCACCAWGGVGATNRVQHDALCVPVQAGAFICAALVLLGPVVKPGPSWSVFSLFVNLHSETRTRPWQPISALQELS